MSAKSGIVANGILISLILRWSRARRPNLTQATPADTAQPRRSSAELDAFLAEDLACNAGDWKTGNTATHRLYLNNTPDTTWTASILSGDDETVWRRIHSKFDDGARDEISDTLYRRSDCKKLRWVFNGVEREVPPGANYELVSTEWRDVTVPAGSYRVICVQTKYQAFRFSRCFNPAETVMEGRIAQRIEKPGSMVILTELMSFKRGRSAKR